MTKDWQEAAEKQDRPAEDRTLQSSETLRSSVQGTGRERQPEQPDVRSFVDGKERNITVRTYENGDSFYIRAYDTRVKQPPERADTGQAGRANLLIQRDNRGVRGRLQDIETVPTYKNSGVGSQMLAQAEDISRQKGAYEIYGLAPSAAREREWYNHRGYQFRDGAQGEEVHRPLRVKG
jgi:GNAT superfamily N-acetyltransferase